MRRFLYFALYALLLSHPLLSLVDATSDHAQPLARSLGVGNGNGNRGDGADGPTVPSVGTDADGDNGDDGTADGDDDGNDTTGTPGFLDSTNAVDNADADDTAVKPGLGALTGDLNKQGDDDDADDDKAIIVDDDDDDDDDDYDDDADDDYDDDADDDYDDDADDDFDDDYDDDYDDDADDDYDDDADDDYDDDADDDYDDDADDDFDDDFDDDDDAPTSSPSVTSTPTATASDAPSLTPTQTPSPTTVASDAPSSTPTQTPVPTVAASDAPSSTPTQTPVPTAVASDSPSSTPTQTPSPTAGASDSPSSTPTQTPSPTAGASDSSSSTPTTDPNDPAAALLTSSPTSALTSLSTTKDNQAAISAPVTRFLRPFSVRLSVKDGETATDEEIQVAVKLSLAQLLETKLGLVFSDLTGIFLDYVATQSRSVGSEVFSFTGKGFFDSTPVTAPSHAALQAAQMKVLFEFLFELEEMLKDNGIAVDTVVVQVSSDAQQDAGISDKSSGEGQQEITFFDDDDENDERGTILLGVQDEPTGSSSVYIVIAATLTVSVGLIVLGVKRGFGSTKEPEPVSNPRRHPRENVMVVDAEESPV